MTSKMKSVFSLVAVSLAFLAGNAVALEFEATVGLRESFSTNPGRAGTSEEEEEQFIHAPNVSVGLTHSSQTLELEADYSAERRIYEEDDPRFEDENVLTGSSSLTWNVAPERFLLGVEHYRT